MSSEIFSTTGKITKRTVFLDRDFDMTNDDWQEMLKQALTGDIQAFGTLYQYYLTPKMYRVAPGILEAHDEAKDIIITID